MAGASVDEAELCTRLESELETTVRDLDLISAGSNLVYRATAEDGSRYSVRVAHLDPSRLSAFWSRMELAFGHAYRRRMDGIGDLLTRLASAKPGFELPTHRASFSFGALPVTVLSWIDGQSWDPDDFPDSPAVQKQLGRYLGRVHLLGYEYVGTIRRQTTTRAEFIECVTADARNLLQVHWSSRPEVASMVEPVLDTDRTDELVGRIAPVMPDVSGNQFVYSKDAIRGLVDLDSYVIGPVEWELSVVEMTLTSPDPFRAGYEESLPMPRFDAFRDFYRVLTFLSGPDEDYDLSEYLHRRRLFP
jgi:Ser/Thr protein kinase RdoA (MazF antagonist)